MRVGGIQTQEDDIFMGAVETQDGKPWSVSLLLNKTPVDFHIDTGAGHLETDWETHIASLKTHIEGPGLSCPPGQRTTH